MTIEKALSQITSEKKYYVGKMPQSTASRIVIAIRNGTAKMDTVKEFMSKFGYEIQTDMEWKKR